MTPKRIPTEAIVSSVEAVLSRQRELSESAKDNIRSRIASTIQSASLPDSRHNTYRNCEPNATNTNAKPFTTATIPYIKGTSETIARILQPYNIRVAHKPITTLRQLLTNVKDKDEPSDRRGAVYKIKCCDCQVTYIGETGRNLNVRLTEHKRAIRNGDINNHIAEHHLKTNRRIDGDSAECVTYSTDYYQRITLESWFTNLEQTPPATEPYKRLIADNNKTDKQ